MTHRALVTTIRHPSYLRDQIEWQEWRDAFEGGKYYRDRYLQKFSDRETDNEFSLRTSVTPIPTFARSAITDVRNSIYQRLVGVTRVGGSAVYQDAIGGNGGGVDGEGNTMDSFIGKDVLTELLVMGKVGVYVDAAPPLGETLADPTFPPYLSYYRVEDILSFTRAPRGQGGEFSAVLLRDWNVSTSVDVFGISLPDGAETQFRLVWKDPVDDQVYFRLFDKEGAPLAHPSQQPDGRVLTGLKRVPFVMFDIGEALMKDVVSYQHALLNLSSSDVYYALRSNTTFLTIQQDSYKTGSHLKKADAAEGGEGPVEQMGGGKGRYYGLGMNAPAFIAPPTAPLEASMQLQGNLKDDIRSLINLAVANKQGTRTESAASKKIGAEGLENGLAFIGMELACGERIIAQMWAEYESKTNPNPATVNYPDRYILKTDMERIEEAESLVDLAQRLPGKGLKKAVTKQVIVALVGGKLPQDEVNTMLSEVDTGKYLIGGPDDILAFHKEGLVSDVTASDAGGFDGENEVEQAREDRSLRIAATLAAQTPKGEGDDEPVNPASRGAPELDTNPQSGEEEKE